MSERQLSLIDVQVGMYKLSLQTRLTPPCFRFFWGLIMLANELNPRFKNPFDVTVEQAVGIGGGLSRQSINDKQKALRKIKVDGEWLVKIKAGSKVNNRPALYEINYDLLVPQSLYIPTFEVQPSRKIDGTIDGSLDGTLDDPPSILRSDQRRGEKTTTEVVAVLPSSEEEDPPVLTIKSDAHIISGAILHKWRNQIMDVAPAPDALREALELYTVEQLLEAKERSPVTLKSKNSRTKIDGNYALSVVCYAAKNPGWWRTDDGGNGGMAVNKPNAQECEEELGKLREQREGVVDAPDSDFTERRILREHVLLDIDQKIAYYEGVMKGE